MCGCRCICVPVHCVWRILTEYWQDVDYPACRRMGPVWSSGGSQATEEWWDNQSVRGEREEGICQGRGWWQWTVYLRWHEHTIAVRLSSVLLKNLTQTHIVCTYVVLTPTLGPLWTLFHLVVYFLKLQEATFMPSNQIYRKKKFMNTIKTQHFAFGI